MQDYQEKYKTKLVTAEEAVSHINSGDRVAVGHACGEPQILTQAFARRAKELEDVETVHMIGMG